ncbi:MAG: O-antigen ligase family protein [Solirubrobacterales bacterium]
MPGYYAATAVVDACLLAMIVFGGWYLAQHQDEPIEIWEALLVLLIGIFLALAILSPESPYAVLSTIRSRGMYVIVGAFVAITITRELELQKLIQWMIRFAALIAAFGVVQFVLRGALPDWLLYSKDTELFGYYGTDITRSTGLIGNSIVYANTMLLFFAITVSQFAYRPSWRTSALPALFALAIFVSFSRTALAGAVCIAVLVAVVELFRRGTKNAIQFGSIAGAIAVVLGIFLVSYTNVVAQLQNSFIYQGLFMGGNESVQGSTERHVLFLETGSKIFHENPSTGLGLATQAGGSEFAEFNTLITDSAWSALLAEGGLVLALTYAALLIAAVVTVARRTKHLGKYAFVARGFLVFSVYEFCFASVVSSAYFGKAVFLAYWMFFGAIIGLSRRRSPVARSGPSWTSSPSPPSTPARFSQAPGKTRLT